MAPTGRDKTSQGACPGPLPDAPTTTPPRVVSFREAFVTWCRVAALSFGGPAGQIAVMHRILVEEKRWISEGRFLHALNYCMLLPGPEAQQLATYIGWLMHRTPGGLAAGILFILPGAVAIGGLSVAYAYYQHTDLLQAVFFGLKPAVLAIVLEAAVRIGSRILKNRALVGLAIAAFVAIFVCGVPFPVLILAAALVGFVSGRLWPEKFDVKQGQREPSQDAALEPTDVDLQAASPSWSRAARVTVVCLTLWMAPVAVFRYALGPDSVYVQLALFFSQAAVVTFGGAYAVLAYIAQQAVEQYGWLQPNEMLDGLGMAETTPGPLIMVVQFVGFLGAHRNPGPFQPLVAGLVGSLITTWVTFVPCFLWIFLGAPYIERLRTNRLLTSALSAITAAVVGVIVNLAMWFALHVLFERVSVHSWHGLRILVPELASVNLPACAIALLALLLTFWWKQGLAVTLAVCTALGAVLYLCGASW